MLVRDIINQLKNAGYTCIPQDNGNTICSLGDVEITIVEDPEDEASPELVEWADNHS